ncbi:MAG: family 78 glycoside hydrolase catalytic domain [Armatimonadetes bacterium]|nr:family 78 glycoside hydrolase catalytic domain [Armatimonadota bacterium]
MPIQTSMTRYLSVSFSALAALSTMLALPHRVAVAAPATLAAPTGLQCETMVSPLGIEERQPRLSWRVNDPRRGARQSAYQLRVATTPRLLASGKADLWDTGKVASDRSVLVEYGGKPLRSRQRVYWAVRTWDGAGKPSPFSKPAVWEMGLLDRDDWKAKWVGLAPEPEEFDLKGLSWVWHPEATPAPNATRYFRRTLTYPEGRKITHARFLLAADNRFTLYVNGREAGQGNDWRSPTVIDIQSFLKPGTNVLAIEAKNEDGPAGLMGQLRVAHESGVVIRKVKDPVTGKESEVAMSNAAMDLIPIDQEWKSSDRLEAGWLTPGFEAAGWTPVQVLAKVGEAPWGPVNASGTANLRAPLLRKGFTLSKPIQSARAYVTGLGSYRLFLNGARVGNEVWSPDWTDYRKRVRYQTYDVTPLLKTGDNAAGAMLGDGWYASGLGWNLQRYSFGPPPLRLLAQIEVTYKDGSKETVLSDGSWKATPGPILRSELYAGENYDARLDPQGWHRPGFNAAGWQNVEVLKDWPAALESQVSPPIRITGNIKPVRIAEPSPGVFIYDMGQNMVGWARLKVNGKRGDTVRLRFAEILKPDGHLYRENLRKADATDTYILRGGEEEVWEPHFTYHGFRYVEVTGYPGRPDLNSILGRVFHTDAPITGKFVTSSPLVNQLQHNILWGQKGNLMSVPTDCPQRDERLGWMGDAQLFAKTSTFNMDLQSFYTKWMQDIVDAQSADGGFSDVSPRVVDLADGAPAWGDAGIIIPWTVYQMYGDTRIVERNFGPMEKWMNYIHSANQDLIWRNRRNNDFGDWVPAGSNTPKDVIATAYFAWDAHLMSEMAEAIGRKADAEKYAKLADGIKKAFNKEFVTPDGKIKGDTQTAYAMALYMDLLPAEVRPLAAKHLVADIEKRGYHLSTGFIGTEYLLPALSDTGHTDVAYRLLNQRTYPSWGYMIDKGATTIWERWNGDTGDPSMNSFNHFAFGSVGEWMYGYLAGIDVDPNRPGYKHVMLRPRPGGGLTHAEAVYESAYGPIASVWKREGNGTSYTFTVPANTTATVILPTSGQARITESGKPVAQAAGVKLVREEPGASVFTLGAGTYRSRTE